MEANLKDVVKLNYGFQEALQGAGRPDQAGLGAFIPKQLHKMVHLYRKRAGNRNVYIQCRCSSRALIESRPIIDRLGTLFLIPDL